MLAGRAAANCGNVRRRRRFNSCSCRRRNGVGDADNRPNLACIGEEITEMPRNRRGFIDLDVMLQWVYQEPIIANLMNLPVVVCQERVKVFFNCQVLEPNQSLSLESTLPYKIYAVLGTAKPSNWNTLLNLVGPISKLIGPISVVASAYTGGLSAGAYAGVSAAVQKAVTKYVAKDLAVAVGGLANIGIDYAKDRIADGAQEALESAIEKLAAKNPEMFSAWSSTFGNGEHYLKIVGGIGGDTKQSSSHSAIMNIEETSKEDFAKEKITSILPEP